MAAQPTHKKLVFLRDVHMRKEHVTGAPTATSAEDLMMVVRRGEQKSIVRVIADDLIVAASAFEDSSNNRGRKEDFLKELEDEKKSLKKAA
jgi:hypothetical protein